MDFPLQTIQLLGYPVYGNPHIFIDNVSPFSSPGRTVLSSWLAALHSRGCPSNGTGRQIRKKVDLAAMKYWDLSLASPTKMVIYIYYNILFIVYIYQQYYTILCSNICNLIYIMIYNVDFSPSEIVLCLLNQLQQPMGSWDESQPFWTQQEPLAEWGVFLGDIPEPILPSGYD